MTSNISLKALSISLQTNSSNTLETTEKNLLNRYSAKKKKKKKEKNKHVF